VSDSVRGAIKKTPSDGVWGQLSGSMLFSYLPSMGMG
jgi:hypothetical protein